MVISKDAMWLVSMIVHKDVYIVLLATSHRAAADYVLGHVCMSVCN